MHRTISLAASGLAAAGVLLSAAPANAATMIKPQPTAPQGASSVSATVTVKNKGKTVARNVKKFKAKKSGKYRVTTTTNYALARDFTPVATDVTAECRVTGQTIASDSTSYYRLLAMNGKPYQWEGPVTFEYQGACVDEVQTPSGVQQVRWDARWKSPETITTGTYGKLDYTLLDRALEILRDDPTSSANMRLYDRTRQDDATHWGKDYSKALELLAQPWTDNLWFTRLDQAIKAAPWKADSGPNWSGWNAMKLDQATYQSGDLVAISGAKLDTLPKVQILDRFSKKTTRIVKVK